MSAELSVVQWGASRGWSVTVMTTATFWTDKRRVTERVWNSLRNFWAMTLFKASTVLAIWLDYKQMSHNHLLCRRCKNLFIKSKTHFMTKTVNTLKESFDRMVETWDSWVINLLLGLWHLQSEHVFLLLWEQIWELIESHLVAHFLPFILCVMLFDHLQCFDEDFHSLWVLLGFVRFSMLSLKLEKIFDDINDFKLANSLIVITLKLSHCLPGMSTLSVPKLE